MIQRNLQDACKSLHLSYIIDHYDEISFETKEQFLRDIFNIELESRQTKKVANLIKKAKFRELKWLKNYEWSEQIHLPSTTSQEHICELRFLKANKIFITWISWNRKTHLATALGLKACEQGYQVKFFRVADLVGLLEEALQQGNLTRIKKQIEACDLLILDELGYVPFQKQGAELLFHIIADCYEQKSVIVTSNLEFGQWNRIFGDNRLTSALVTVWSSCPYHCIYRRKLSFTKCLIFWKY